MIRINLFISVKTEKRARLLDVATSLTEASLKDDGCVAYDIFESHTRPDVLMICETWRDEAALTAHESAPHFTTLVPQLRELSDEMKSEKFQF